MAKDKNMRITTPDGEEGGSGPKRLLVTLVIIVLILYVGAFFGLKTDGARSLVEGSMSKRLGMEVQIGETALALPLGVAMSNVRAGDPAESLPGFLAETIKVRLLSGSWIGVEVSGVDLVLVRNDDGTWAPRCFSSLGDLPAQDLAGLSVITKEFRSRVSVDVDGAMLKWIGDNGQAYVVMEGVDFVMESVKLPRSRMYHYDLAVFKYAVDGAGGALGRSIKREWLAGEDADYIEISVSGDMQGVDRFFGQGMMEIDDEEQ